ncbi:hypothetical protein A2755_01635 [Candidatus Wolfebacteria bacterium RIFCSPHIGHO2_01_FULL_48_22]|uniref:Peptidase M14 domain-containing protein n=2 Tax=Candidatus Wolfeibacteriota TaxID=1752735 RepID=A0A1F8DSV0_9BACT|nr:MAG: hypothetical protein A2755_01635 [Candidatus Wolfebacteria bacterium RIFCSPHIGHO2_01_FULL_48_22]OGM91939.1 MAG: hypothetical protein A2935_02275 [Candidatus Wolfebacteria bacterium RIFCSPLOWO2_01_FULL_47_17b]
MIGPFSSKRTVTTAIGIAVVLIAAGIILIVSTNTQKQESLATPSPQTPYRTQEAIGTSVEGRAIERFTYGNGDTHLVFVGGIHGGYEYNSVLLAYEFIDYFNENIGTIPQSMSVTIIPSLNPDGVEKGAGEAGRFNAHSVDLNRNFNCKWKPTSTWRSKTVSAGTAPFSEPEAAVLRDFVTKTKPTAVVFWHSQSNAVYASECYNGILPKTLDSMRAYAQAAGYPAVESFDAYPISGDAEGWLASIGIPAITVELSTHETIEWEKNLAGVKALMDYHQTP